ncbi:MAG: SMI1/KNR4 family protein [Planctomycetota bacterium]
MNESDFQRIESELEIKLPRQYRELMSPFPVRAYIGNDDMDLWDDPATLIEFNQKAHHSYNWPDHLMAIGGGDAGDRYAIDLSSEIAAVWWIDRAIDAPGTAPLDQSFADWAREIFKDMADGEYDGAIAPMSDPPGTRDKPVPITFGGFFGCFAMILGVAVIGALIIFGIQLLLGY